MVVSVQVFVGVFVDESKAEQKRDCFPMRLQVTRGEEMVRPKSKRWRKKLMQVFVCKKQ